MPSLERFAIAVLTLGAMGVACAAPTTHAPCAAELTAGATAPITTLPMACQTLGPLHLGMTRAEMIEAMGVPDQIVDSGPYRGAIYVFPRSLGTGVQSAFKKTIYIHVDAVGSVQVLLDAGKVVSIHMQTSPLRPMPFKVGNIALEQPVDALLREIKTPARWNAARDIALFAPYPIAVQIDPGSRRIRGITIATTSVH